MLAPPQVSKVTLVTKTGTQMELHPTTKDNPAPLPTFAPYHIERQVNTRATAAGGRHRPLQEVSLQYSLCNEPWLKYTFVNIADRGLKPSLWTSSRLQDEVVYFETRTERFQLARAVEGASSSGVHAAAPSSNGAGTSADQVRSNWAGSQARATGPRPIAVLFADAALHQTHL